MIKEVSVDKSTWNDLPWKFETGTQDVCGAIALGGATDPRIGEKLTEAVDFLNAIGMDNVFTLMSGISALMRSLSLTNFKVLYFIRRSPALLYAE